LLFTVAHASGTSILFAGVRIAFGVPPSHEEFLTGVGVDVVLSAISCGLARPALFSNIGSGAVAVAIQAALRRAVAIGAASHVAVLAGNKVFAYARIGGGGSSGAGANGGNESTGSPNGGTDGSARFRRWKRGDAIDKPMPDGSPPSSSTVQSRYWKNRYEAAKNSGEFTPSQLAEMRKGNAPMDYNPRTGNWERRELHHVDAQRFTVDNSPRNLRELRPDWHAEVDPFRRVPGITPNRGIR
jgi:hypothetical protein